tara:strand:+ start:42 stop:818 length:777 start_codon:yes stop_codon:yes gene_type:complete
MRVIIEYDPWGRLGNRMFQYAFAYLLAKQFDCELFYNEGLPNFGIIPKPVDKLQSNIIKARSLGNQHFDFDAIKNFDGDIIIDSFVQKSKYYINNRQLIREIFGIKNLDIINKDVLVLHVRGGDYHQLKQFLGLDFYKGLIDYSECPKVKIVTDDPKCETVTKLLEYGCELETNTQGPEFNINGDRSAMDDMKTLLYSENIALSQSSFAWWPAFLGFHKKIIFPYSLTLDTQSWPVEPKHDDIDLFFDFNNICHKYIL